MLWAGPAKGYIDEGVLTSLKWGLFQVFAWKSTEKSLRIVLNFLLKGSSCKERTVSKAVDKDGSE